MRAADAAETAAASAIEAAAAKEASGTATVTKVTGEASIVIDGEERPLRADDKVPAKATVKTGAGASMAITLSNGALLHLGAESQMILEVFAQASFTASGKVEEMAWEPSTSRVVGRLIRGELAAQLPRLRGSRGSSLNISTDAGLLWTQFGGATFMAKANATDVLIVVTEGEMRFRPPSKDEITIVAGDQLRAEVLGAALLKEAGN